jgi:hypothetical protein
MANPWEFLEGWARENVGPSGHDAEAVAKHLARECLAAADRAHINKAAVIKAAGGNLESFILTELESAANREIDRLAVKRER